MAESAVANLVEHPVASAKHPLHTLKKVAIGVAIFWLSAYLLSRLAPGAAARAGVRPRPFFNAQNNWPEPFGMRSLGSYFRGNVVAAAQTGGDQSSLGQSGGGIIPNALTSVGNSLAAITGGSGTTF